MLPMRDLARAVPGLSGPSMLALRGSMNPSAVEVEGALPLPWLPAPVAVAPPPVSARPAGGGWSRSSVVAVRLLSPLRPGCPAAASPPVLLPVELGGGAALARTGTGGLHVLAMLLFGERKTSPLLSVAPLLSPPCWSSSSDSSSSGASCCRTSSTAPTSVSLMSLAVDWLGERGELERDVSSSGVSVASGVPVRPRRSLAVAPPCASG